MKYEVGRMKVREVRCRIFRIRNSSRGAALVITLSILVLVTVLVLTLFLTVTHERTESAASANQGDAQRLASSVVNLVKSTITQATMGYEAKADGSPDTASPTAWASQPGLIRTWKQGGTADKSFRLYSSGEVVNDGALNLADEQDDLSVWKDGAPATAGSYNALWCDLNAPVVNQSDERIYPIVTPPKDTKSGSTATDSTYGVPTDNPSTPGQDGVQGFAVTTPPGYSGSDPSPVNNPAPMPVKWLYVLQDGSFISPTGSGTVVTVGGATKDNPIVGRVAFWTDDETCKVNVNTASEGVYWDIPVAKNSNELVLGANQPAQNEFNRYPGHPATTSLSAVFPNFSFSSGNNMAEIFSNFPRVGWGGSLGGTRQLDPADGAAPGSGGRPPIKTDRVYAGADEILYAAAKSPREDNSSLSAGDVKARNFFLTAASRAPEVNMLNAPRVSLWPITTDAVGSTAHSAGTRQDGFDKMFKFASTLNAEDFFFARSDARSSTYDWTIPRNQKLINYLTDLTDREIPGYGGSFSGKYGSNDRDALLVQAFDYVRSGPALLRVSDMKADNRMFPGYTHPLDNYTVWDDFSRLVVPIRTDTSTLSSGYKGMGNFLGINQVGIGFYAYNIEPLDASGNSTSANGTFSPATTRVRYTVRPVLLLQTHSLTAGYARTAFFLNRWHPSSEKRSIRFSVTENGPMVPSLSAVATTNNGTGSGSISFPWGSPSEVQRYTDMSKNWDSGNTVFSPQAFLLKEASNNKVTEVPETEGRRVYIGDPIQLTYDIPVGWAALDAAHRKIYRLEALLTKGISNSAVENPPGDWGPRMAFSGMDMTIKLAFTGEASTIPDADVLQTIRVKFDPVPSLPVPSWTARDVDYKTTVADGKDFPPAPPPNPKRQPSMEEMHNMRKFLVSRINGIGDPDNTGSRRDQPLFMLGDVVRSLELTGTTGFRGDWRLAALTPALSDTLFAPPLPDGVTGSNYESDVYRLHAFTVNIDSMHGQPSAARLVSGLPFTTGGANRENHRPTSTNLNGAVMSNGAPGDWNNSFGKTPDGAMFNMPDFGAIGQTSSSYFNDAIYGLGNENNARQFKVMYSPNRQMYSAIQLGSLLTEAAEQKPWQTLLFCPNSASSISGVSHPGEANPPDHLFADLFWVPVVDPYAISEPFSTAGKINLNYQIAPFTHITRATGIHALLNGVKVAAIPDALATGNSATAYKGPGASPSQQLRFDIDVTETLKSFAGRFEPASGSLTGAFKSATEICEIPLVPAGRTQANVKSWWADKRLTGDNTREAPYAQILPRVTTKSNTFTVHLRVQSLKQVPGWRTSAAQWETWDETRDQVLSEYRGSASIERYVDPNDINIPDFAQPANYSKNLAPYYRWRTVTEKQFVP